jgi:hypothetical protein
MIKNIVIYHLPMKILNSKIEELEGFMSSNVGKGKPEEEKKDYSQVLLNFGRTTKVSKSST